MLKIYYSFHFDHVLFTEKSQVMLQVCSYVLFKCEVIRSHIAHQIFFKCLCLTKIRSLL